jgi:hypothetical protein
MPVIIEFLLIIFLLGAITCTAFMCILFTILIKDRVF